MNQIRELPEMTRDEFVNFIKKAIVEKSNEYKRLYFHLSKCFVDADRDLDGRITAEEFSFLIDNAARLPRKYGYAPSKQMMFGGDNNLMKKSRLSQFKEIDNNNDGTITFDEFLKWCRNHIEKKVTDLSL